MINNFVTTYKLIKKNWKHLLLLVCVYNIVLFLVLVPLLSAGFNLALTMTKYSYLTENNFKNFLLRPQSIVMIIVSILLLVIFFQTQTASLFYFYEDCKNQKKMNVAQLIIAGVKSTISLVKRKAFPVFLYSLLMPVFLNIPLLLTLFRQQRRTSFIVKSMLRVPYAKPILLIAMVLLIIYLYRRLFVLPICILDKKTFKRARNRLPSFRRE